MENFFGVVKIILLIRELTKVRLRMLEVHFSVLTECQ